MCLLSFLVSRGVVMMGRGRVDDGVFYLLPLRGAVAAAVARGPPGRRGPRPRSVPDPGVRAVH